MRRDGAATTRMLELVCDVVVELDCNLAIKERRLAGPAGNRSVGL